MTHLTEKREDRASIKHTTLKPVKANVLLHDVIICKVKKKSLFRVRDNGE